MQRAGSPVSLLGLSSLLCQVKANAGKRLHTASRGLQTWGKILPFPLATRGLSLSPHLYTAQPGL